MPRPKLEKYDSATRAAIVQATETIMIEEGHAAVTTRRIASLAGIKSPLIHYYFDNMDELIREVYFKVEQRYVQRLEAACRSDTPLRDLWELSSDYNDYETKMMMEFITLAASSKIIAEESSKTINKIREIEAAIVETALQRGSPRHALPPAPVIAFMITGSARRILHEKAVGITAGHDAVVEHIERFILEVEGPAEEVVRTGAARAAP